MIVCICKGLSDRDVEAAIESGCTTEEAVGADCGAGTDCGSCLVSLRALLIERRGHRNDARTSPIGHPGLR